MTPRECLNQHHESVPEECYMLKYRFFECKRSLVNIFNDVLKNLLVCTSIDYL